LTFGEEEAMEIGTIEALMVEEETAGDMIVMEVGDGKADIHHLEMVIDIERHHMEMIVVMKAKAEKDVPELPLITTMIPDSTDKIDRVMIVIHQEDINRSHISWERNK